MFDINSNNTKINASDVENVLTNIQEEINNSENISDKLREIRNNINQLSNIRDNVEDNDNKLHIVKSIDNAITKLYNNLKDMQDNYKEHKNVKALENTLISFGMNDLTEAVEMYYNNNSNDIEEEFVDKLTKFYY